MHCVIFFSDWYRTWPCAIFSFSNTDFSKTRAMTVLLHSLHSYTICMQTINGRGRELRFADTSSLPWHDILTLELLHCILQLHLSRTATTTTTKTITDRRHNRHSSAKEYQRFIKAQSCTTPRTVEGADWKKFFSFKLSHGLLYSRCPDPYTSEQSTGCGGSLFAFALESLATNTTSTVKFTFLNNTVVTLHYSQCIF